MCQSSDYTGNNCELRSITVDTGIVFLSNTGPKEGHNLTLSTIVEYNEEPLVLQLTTSDSALLLVSPDEVVFSTK